MSGVQGGGCRFNNELNLLMNFERPTRCQYYMRYVVAYVVADVALVRALMSAFDVADMPRCTRWSAVGQSTKSLRDSPLRGTSAATSSAQQSARTLARCDPPPRFRALALFGRRPPERVVGIVGTGVRKPAHFRTDAAHAN
jgi:hypothetical protein